MVSATRKRRSSAASNPDRGNDDDDERSRAIATALVVWYQKHHRALPWRKLADPYTIWVSEIMLQQTQVVTVIPYFERWMRAFPTLDTLARAALGDVLAAWQGLGYYSRARNLHRSACLLSDAGAGLPSDIDELLKLPGIGRYTAGAIASIAFDRPVPAVDGNVERVVTRLQALRGDPKATPTARRIFETVAAWLKYASPRRFNQALMELGALVCTSDNPQCGSCPLLSHCRAQRARLVSQLPESRRRPEVQKRNVVVLLSRQRDSLLVVQQPETARHWAGLFTLPYLEYDASRSAPQAARQLLKVFDPKATLLRDEHVARLHYPITRFRFEAQVFEVSTLRASRAASLGGSYVASHELSGMAMPAPHRRILRLLQFQRTSSPVNAPDKYEARRGSSARQVSFLR